MTRRIWNNGIFRADSNQMQAVDGKQEICLEWPYYNFLFIKVHTNFIIVQSNKGRFPSCTAKEKSVRSLWGRLAVERLPQIHVMADHKKEKDNLQVSLKEICVHLRTFASYN